jgi:hypothetical protein
MKSARLLLLAIALASTACVEDEPVRASANLADTVQIADREPGGACRPVVAVEVRSGPNDLPSADTLRAYAHERGANYVVLDTFSVYDESDTQVLTRARLFRCPLACVATMQ